MQLAVSTDLLFRTQSLTRHPSTPLTASIPFFPFFHRAMKTPLQEDSKLPHYAEQLTLLPCCLVFVPTPALQTCCNTRVRVLEWWHLDDKLLTSVFALGGAYIALPSVVCHAIWLLV